MSNLASDKTFLVGLSLNNFPNRLFLTSCRRMVKAVFSFLHASGQHSGVCGSILQKFSSYPNQGKLYDGHVHMKYVLNASDIRLNPIQAKSNQLLTFIAYKHNHPVFYYLFSVIIKFIKYPQLFVKFANVMHAKDLKIATIVAIKHDLTVSPAPLHSMWALLGQRFSFIARRGVSINVVINSPGKTCIN